VAEESDNDPVLTDEEIEALVEHAEDGAFDDGEFRAHDFSAGESLTLSKWSELEGLHRSHADVLGKSLSSTFDIDLTAEAKPSRFVSARELLTSFPQRLCLVSASIGPFSGESIFRWRIGHATHLDLKGNALRTAYRRARCQRILAHNVGDLG